MSRAAPRNRAARTSTDFEALTRANKAAARLILSDIPRNGGEGSLAVEWARLVLGIRERDQMGLFEGAA